MEVWYPASQAWWVKGSSISAPKAQVIAVAQIWSLARKVHMLWCGQKASFVRNKIFWYAVLTAFFFFFLTAYFLSPRVQWSKQWELKRLTDLILKKITQKSDKYLWYLCWLHNHISRKRENVHIGVHHEKTAFYSSLSMWGTWQVQGTDG